MIVTNIVSYMIKNNLCNNLSTWLSSQFMENIEIKEVFHSCLYSYPENVLPEDKTILETYTFP